MDGRIFSSAQLVTFTQVLFRQFRDLGQSTMCVRSYKWSWVKIACISVLLSFSLKIGLTQKLDERIVFMSDRDGNREIYTMNPDGTDVVGVVPCPIEPPTTTSEDKRNGNLCFANKGKAIEARECVEGIPRHIIKTEEEWERH